MAKPTKFLPEFVKTTDARPLTPQHGARYEIPSAQQEQIGLWVSGVGYSVSNGGATMNRTLGTYAAVLVTGGRMFFESAPTGRHTVLAGTLFWLFPTIAHSYGGEGGAFAERWILFGGKVADDFERQGVLAPARCLVPFRENHEPARLVEHVQETFFKGGPLAVPLASALLHQLIVTMHGIATGFSGAGENADPVVAQALAIVEKESTGGLLPETLAERLHVGYSTLRRRFKQQTGYAVKEYILRVQLRRAKELLAFTKMPVEQVAEATGFADPFYFSRLFREREGVPPSVFRTHQTRELE
ncbi:MAG: AraC family transcriptional regulator [Planctomycetes bacterium]|nr:AraC family transcriptional regulator [Planctomycetota bacterium]